MERRTNLLGLKRLLTYFFKTLGTSVIYSQMSSLFQNELINITKVIEELCLTIKESVFEYIRAN